jgi:DNA-binding NarL/FixJ family response regulator
MLVIRLARGVRTSDSTNFDTDDHVTGAFKAGAKGFLLKDAGPDLLLQAIRAAAEGDALIAPSVTTRLLASFAERANSSNPAQPFRTRGRGPRDSRPRSDQRRDRRRAAHQPQRRTPVTREIQT